MALLECRPGRKSGGSNGNPYCCSALHFFYCLKTCNLQCVVPDSSQTLKDWVDKGFIYCFLVFLFHIFRFLLRKLVCVIGDGVYVVLTSVNHIVHL